MTAAIELLVDAFDRVRDAVHEAVDGLTSEQLELRPTARANSIAWLVWHLARVQDDHVADVAGAEQVWISQGWRERFALPFEPGATGYGHDQDEVAMVEVKTPALLVSYYEAVHEQTAGYLASLDDGDLSRVVDKSWDPPVSLAVRLVSVVADDLQHAGQAAYLRGLLTAD